MKGIDSYTERALDNCGERSRADALNIREGDKATRERYKGVEHSLTARRLVEAGVGFVTLSIGGWDTHGQNFVTLKKQLPKVDAAIANLIQTCTTAACRTTW